VRWIAVCLALIVAGAYGLMGAGVLDVGSAAGPPGIVYAAAASYATGGLLLLARLRWLWLLGAIVNALVLLVFVEAQGAHADVVLSPGALVSKTAQVLLELALLYLILGATSRRGPRGPSASTAASCRGYLVSH
jgi:hypothetical protein